MHHQNAVASDVTTEDRRVSLYLLYRSCCNITEHHSVTVFFNIFCKLKRSKTDLKMGNAKQQFIPNMSF